MLIRLYLCIAMLAIAAAQGATAPGAGAPFVTDTIATDEGNVLITFIGHASLVFDFAGMTVHVDPWGKLAEYSTLPKADLVLVTHNHPDHFDQFAIDKIWTKKAQIIMPPGLTTATKRRVINLAYGDSKTIQSLTIDAVPAYNTEHKRPDGHPWHPKGEGNGYLLTFGGKRFYIAGDTENTPEMKRLRNIDVAFLPMNLPYTMTPAMVADAARAMKPKILYPYHYGESDLSELVNLFKDVPAIEIRIRKMP